MILEESIKFEKERLAATTEKPEKSAAEDPFRNETNEKRFGKMLELEGPEGQELAKILVSPKDAKEGDLARIEVVRVKFAEKMKESEKIAKEFTPGNIDDFVSIHPELKNILNSLGEQRAVDMVHKWLPEIAISEPDRFEKIKNNFQRITDLRSNNSAQQEFERLNTSRLIFKTDLDMNAFAKVMSNPNAKERKKELQKMVADQFGGFQKTLSALSRIETGGVSSIITRTAMDYHKIQPLLEKNKQELLGHKKELGKELGLMFTQNDELREALFIEIQNQKSQPKEMIHLKEARSRITTEAEAMEAWEEHKKSPEYKHLHTDAEKQDNLDQWKRQNFDHAEGKDKGGGIWGKIVLAIVESIFAKDIFKK